MSAKKNLSKPNWVQQFKEVRELLSDESRWTQGEYAKDGLGKCVGPKDKNACSWCLVGAFIKVTGTCRQTDKMLSKLGCDVTVFNDNHSHSEVLQLLDKAINANT